jgi:hypothetical protein
MFTKINNDHYGHSTATYGNYVSIGNPPSLRYNPLTSSEYRTGSVDVFQYDINADQHVLVATLHTTLDDDILLAKEDSYLNILHTESSGSDEFYGNKDIEVDEGTYVTQSEDNFGYSIDINSKNIMAVGCTYFSRSAHFHTSSFGFSGSFVSLYDLNRFDINQYVRPSIFLNVTRSYISASKFVQEYIVPPGYDYVNLEASSDFINWQPVDRSYAPINGGFVVFRYSIFLSPLGFFRAKAYASNDSYITSIPNPDPQVSGSFGWSVSITDNWLAIGSPYVSSSKGMVYIYKHYTDHPASWSLYQKIEPSDGVEGEFFGISLRLNRITGSRSGSLIIGVGGTLPSSSLGPVDDTFTYDGFAP